MRRRTAWNEDKDRSMSGERAGSAQPLLDEPEDQGHASRGAIVVSQGQFDLLSFLLHILSRTTAQLTAALYVCWNSLFWTSQRSLTATEAARLADLREKAAQPYSADDAECLQALQDLWRLAFPGEAWPPQIRSPKWKELGFQGEDPGTDFRGAGLLGLQDLVQLACNQPDVFRRLMNKTLGASSDFESCYPFAAAGINITYMLTTLVELQQKQTNMPSARLIPDPAAMPATPAARGFVQLLGRDERAYQQLYAATFEALDRTWVEMGASYMRFNEVLKRVRLDVEAALKSRPADVARLRQLLKLDMDQ